MCYRMMCKRDRATPESASDPATASERRVDSAAARLWRQSDKVAFAAFLARLERWLARHEREHKETVA